MFDSGILDVVIGVVVVYLQLSLVCTAVNELVALWLSKRATELEKGIRGLLTKPELVEKFYDHPLITALRPDGRKPSYIPSRTFSLALMDIVRRHSFDGTVTAATQALADKTAARDAATTALTVAETALTAAQTVNQAAKDALAAAGTAEKLQASKAAQEAANNETAAQTARDSAKANLDAAELALTTATQYKVQVTKDAETAKQTEIDAQAAEAKAKANLKDESLQSAAQAARAAANTAADKLAPSASSLLSEARDKVAGVHNVVVPAQLQTALLALMDDAGTNLNKAQANLEQWFNDAMDRVSGGYKRKSHVFIVIIAVVITVLANVDTLDVADALSHDKALRDTIVAAAPALAKADTDLVNQERGINPNGSPAPPPPSTSAPGTNPTVPPADQGNSKPPATPTPTPAPLPKPSLSTIKASIDELKTFGLPIGYIRVCTTAEEPVLAKSKQLEDAAVTAEAAAQSATAKAQAAKAEADANPQDTVKKDAAVAAEKATEGPVKDAQEARKKATAQKEGDPKCREASKLTANELKRRLPTTGEHKFVSRDKDNKIQTDIFASLGALISDSWGLLYSHWLGWIMTAFALSLGAPFWFDMLNKLIVVRSTVKPKEKSQDEPSKS